MFGNKSLTTSKKNDRFFAPWLSSLGPWSDSLTPFSNLRDEIMDVFDNFNLANMPSPSTSFMPKVEIKDQGTSYLVAAEVPGMTDKDMSVTVRDNCLILEGEKKE
jgi:HSP20 family molecular chaperone IbpA